MKRLLPFIGLVCSMFGNAQHMPDTLSTVVIPAHEHDVLQVPLDPWSVGQPVSLTSCCSIESSCSEPYPHSYFSSGEFNVDFQLRNRLEYRNGQGALRDKGDLPSYFVNERARLSLNYSNGPVSVGLTGQHTGIWGDDNLISTKGNFALHEAWARLQSRQGWFLQIGRQELSYDDERVFSAEDWRCTGYSHDVLRLGYEHGLHRVHGIVGYNQETERLIGGNYYNGPMAYKNMQMLWYHFGNDLSPIHFSLLGVNLGLELGTVITGIEIPWTGYAQMVGGVFQYKNHGIYGKVEGYYELGHDINKRPLDAFMGTFRLGYVGKKWGLVIGGDHVSGSPVYTKEGKNKCFDLLFGSTHKYFGAMDYFGPFSMPYCGLIDGTGNVYLRPAKRWGVDVDYHYLMTGTKCPGLHRQLGHEVDLHVSWNICKDVVLEGGYSLMMPTSVMVYFNGGYGNVHSLQDWAWLSLSFTPRIFSTKK